VLIENLWVRDMIGIWIRPRRRPYVVERLFSSSSMASEKLRSRSS
jgi:hypothetical protein